MNEKTALYKFLKFFSKKYLTNEGAFDIILKHATEG